MSKLLAICMVAILQYVFVVACTEKAKPKLANSAVVADSTYTKQVMQWATQLKKHATANNYNSQLCFIVNMNIHNGKQRFFVYKFSNDSILASGLVANGNCSENYLKHIKFSNVKQSGCSSYGKYKIGNKYIGRFGLAFKLHGLDSSNSNAFKRNIVLHAHSCIPNQNIYPNYICNSLGCPTVSPSFLQKLHTYIQTSASPILLGIY